jgi:hypothetical protein
MGGTSTEMITQCIYLKLSTTTNRKRLLRNHWDLSAQSFYVVYYKSRKRELKAKLMIVLFFRVARGCRRKKMRKKSDSL